MSKGLYSSRLFDYDRGGRSCSPKCGGRIYAPLEHRTIIIHCRVPVLYGTTFTNASDEADMVEKIVDVC